MTAAGIEPATFRFVAQHINHCTNAATEIPIIFSDNYRAKSSEDTADGIPDEM